jgi:dissimilatory sulfite reductase (desulfoviridin) alpha/beta subunit
MTGNDQAQVVAFTRASVQSMINSVVPDILTALRKEARRGKLSRQHLRLGEILARKGYGREIEEIFRSKRLSGPHVQECIKKNLPHCGKRFANSFRRD